MNTTNQPKTARNSHKRRISQRAMRVAAMFGLSPGDDGDGDAGERAARAAACIDESLPAGGIALIAGPSGGGKSSIARALARRLWSAQRPVVVVQGDDIIRARAGRRKAPVVDLFRGPLDGTLQLLARAGLAEASLFARPWDALSEGQRARLAVALGMEEAARAREGTLILDEFASTLDRLTASALARTVRRFAHSAGARVVCVTAHDDVMEWLAPDVLVEQPLGGEAVVRGKERAA